jgi:hypothetical protein
MNICLPWGRDIRIPVRIMTVLMVLTAVSVPASAGLLSAHAPMLLARGNGAVIISATGVVDITCRGYLIVSPGTALVLPAGAGEPLVMSDGLLLYADIDGAVRMSGRIDAVCGGAGITVFARCDGTVELIGSGYYIMGLKAGVWDAGGVTAQSAQQGR